LYSAQDLGIWHIGKEISRDMGLHPTILMKQKKKDSHNIKNVRAVFE
jgi:hypothetical protein